MLSSEGELLKRVVVSTPRAAYFDPATHAANNIPIPPDRTRTRMQHDELKRILRHAGATVEDLPELPGHPNSVFTRDVALCTPRGYIKLRMGLEARRGEEDWMARALDSLGEPCAGEIVAPGTVEGGDVILAGRVAFLGRSNRTDLEGARQLTALLADMGYEVRVTPVGDEQLHLGGAMSVVGPRTVVCARDAVPAELTRGFEVVAVPQAGPSPGNVIALGNGNVVVNAAENETAIAPLERAGFTVHALDLSEFRKGGGGPTCLILPVARG